MAYPVITAAVLIEANGAALNNSDEKIIGSRTDNTVAVKSIKVGRNRYPYVSGQAWRRWWRETLYGDFSWTPSPVTRESKSAYTEGNPISFADDDMFGYMAAKKGGETQRRVSPLKNSLLISVLPNIIEHDFAHFSRNLPVDNADMIPFEFEHYSTYLQGAFTLSLTDVGRFEIGKMRDLPEGFISESVKAGQEGGIPIATLNADERKKRVIETIKALGQLRYGANLTKNLSDVTPVAIIIGFLDGGNAPFQRIFKCSDDGGSVLIDTPRFSAVLSDFKNRMLDVETPVIFGALPGIITNEDEIKKLDGINYAGSAVDAISMAVSKLQNGNWPNSIWG